MDEPGTRRVRLLVCITDGKPHIRTFLRDALSELSFSVYECEQARDLDVALDAKPPDLVVLGLTAGGVAAGEMLETLAAKDFDGKILPFAPRDSSIVGIIQELAEKLGLAMLPPLLTPFSKEQLREILAKFLPEASSGPLVDIAEAMRGGWLELWYQPKIDARAIIMRGAEALLRIRHPMWGIVPPACFISHNGDARFHAISEFVISRAVDDWYYFFARRGPIETAINLPISFLRNSESVGLLCKQLPNHTAFEGLIVEIDGTEVVRDLKLAIDLANQLRFHKVAISIDDLGAEWPALAGLSSFPFVELKVDRKFVTGCTDDRLKRSICRRILQLADAYGARTVAEGVETWADFLTVQDMGFDLVQGFLFGKPMSAERFAQTCWLHGDRAVPQDDSYLCGGDIPRS